MNKYILVYYPIEYSNEKRIQLRNLKFRETAKTVPYTKFEAEAMLCLHAIIAGSMRGNGHRRSECWLFLGKERREGEGWGEPQPHDLGLKKMGSKHGRLKI